MLAFASGAKAAGPSVFSKDYWRFWGSYDAGLTHRSGNSTTGASDLLNMNAGLALGGALSLSGTT